MSSEAKPTAASTSRSALPLRVGLQYETNDPIDVQRAVWRIADEAGFDQIWNSDHLVRPPSSGNVAGPILDSWTALAAQAQATRRIRIGVLVTANLLRHPALLAKVATTVDHISGGRVEVGLGTGWNEAAFTMLGMPFAEAPERGRRLGEAAAVLKALWTQERANFSGRYYQLKDAIAEPKPVQKPHPPLMIGGRGPVVTLRVAATHGDAWNTSGGRGFDVDLETVRLLDQHCLKVGRDPKTLRRSVIIPWTKAEDALASAKRYWDAGFTEFLIPVTDADSPRQVEILAREALPRLRAIG